MGTIQGKDITLSIGGLWGEEYLTPPALPPLGSPVYYAKRPGKQARQIGTMVAAHVGDGEFTLDMEWTPEGFAWFREAHRRRIRPSRATARRAHHRALKRGQR